jgi:proline iminopeptidase
MRIVLVFLFFILLFSCQSDQKQTNSTEQYFNFSDTGVQTAGIKLIPIQTPSGNFKVWTKRFGNNPRIKVLLLHGGPAMTHEYMECFESFFPKEGFEFYEYDQLGSYYSDQPTDSSLWTTERFVDEVEQVRKALNLTSDNFYLLGNSWGGILAMEYALKYQKNLKGLIICNMMASAPEYGKYADEVLAKQMDEEVLKTIRQIEAANDFTNPKYMELLMPHFYQNTYVVYPNSLTRSIAHSNMPIQLFIQ